MSNKKHVKCFKNAETGEIFYYKDEEGRQLATEQCNTIYENKASKQEVEIERRRIDNITTLAEGSTTGDAELIDARVGADGVTYDNIGNAIRQQYLNLSRNFKNINQLNNHEVIEGKACNEKGIIVNASSYTLIKNIPIQAGVTYDILPNPRFIVLFDTKGNFISATGDSTNDASTTFIAEQTGFANITLYNKNIGEYKCFIEGQFINDVEPYQHAYLGDTVLIKDNGVSKITKGIIQDRVCNTNNLLTINDKNENMYYDTNLKSHSDSKYTYFKVPIVEGISYTVFPRARFLILTDAVNSKTSNSYVDEVTEPTTFTAKANGYAYITFYNSDLDKCYICETGQTDILNYGKYKLNADIIVPLQNTEVAQEINKTINNKVCATNNLLTTGTIKNNVYFDNWLHERENDKYSVIKIKIEKDEKYTVEPRARFLILTDEKGNKSSNSYDDEVFNTTTFTAESDGYAYITTYNTDLNKIKCYKEGVSSNIVQLGKYSLNENIILSNMNIATGNILENKKWAVLGDSFTAGDFNGFTDENGFTGKDSPVIYDKINQMYKTYPWWIMKRNNMVIEKMYQGGRTLATPSDGSFSNCLTYNDMYKNISEDIDYITIYIGINDSHHNSGLSNIDGEDITGHIPLGTINDSTTSTFYGAWNVMLEWLITNRPFAHIGIIVSNGCDSVDYPKATIEVAEKWGIPYLDLNSGYNVPLLHRTIGRDKTCQKAQDIRKTNMIVGNNNQHPSVKTHEYESTFIENFLRSL